MLTAVVLVLSVALVLAVGESVRSQCRRMLRQPVAMVETDESEVVSAPATA